MLTTQIPTDIQNLIVNASFLSKEEAAIYLPPKHVQQAILAELGYHKSPDQNLPAKAAEWVKDQRDYQDRAMKAYQRLQELEPFTEDIAESSNIPMWAIQKWASTLMLDWSANLPSAVIEAEEYLSNLDA